MSARLVFVFLALLVAAGAAAAPSTPAPAKPPVNLDGWYPPADPESASVRLGRRDAPRVDMEFSGGRRSLAALGRAVLAAVADESPEEMLALCVNKTEFETILWPEFPASRPATGLLPMDGWRVVGNRFQAGTRGAVSDHGGQPWTFVRLETTAGIQNYRNFRLHRGLVLVARDTTGTETRMNFLRTAVERKGVFKIFSLRD